MRILILHFLKKENARHAAILKNLEKSAAHDGHEVAVADGDKDISAIHLTIYDYIAVAVPASPLFGAKLPPRLSEVFSSCGNAGGKKGGALVVKAGFSSGKMCRLLMKAMEKNGMLVDYFDIVESPDHALASGKKLG